jgi:hypothetical protein
MQALEFGLVFRGELGGRESSDAIRFLGSGSRGRILCGCARESDGFYGVFAELRFQEEEESGEAGGGVRGGVRVWTVGEFDIVLGMGVGVGMLF